MDIDPNVTILRDAHGTAQHAILPWHRFQALLDAARSDDDASPALQPSAPAVVRRAIAGGAHPVRAWRDHRSLSQAQLASLTGISRAYLAQIEGGERTGTLEVTARIARALGCLIEHLIASNCADFPNMVAALGAMPSRIKDIAAQLPPEAWRQQPAKGGFSLIEHVCHLRDIDSDGYRLRIDRMLKEERPSLADLDGDALARERDYRSQDLSGALAAFAATRWEISARLAKLSVQERQRTGLMAGTNEITIEGLAGIMLAHDSEHLDQLAELCSELRE